MKGIHRLANLGVHHLDSENGRVIVQEEVKSSLGAEVKDKQVWIPYLCRLRIMWVSKGYSFQDWGRWNLEVSRKFVCF